MGGRSPVEGSDANLGGYILLQPTLFVIKFSPHVSQNTKQPIYINPYTSTPSPFQLSSLIQIIKGLELLFPNFHRSDRNFSPFSSYRSPNSLSIEHPANSNNPFYLCTDHAKPFVTLNLKNIGETRLLSLTISHR